VHALSGVLESELTNCCAIYRTSVILEGAMQRSCRCCQRCISKWREHSHCRTQNAKRGLLWCCQLAKSPLIIIGGCAVFECVTMQHSCGSGRSHIFLLRLGTIVYLSRSQGKSDHAHLRAIAISMLQCALCRRAVSLLSVVSLIAAGKIAIVRPQSLPELWNII
jgi:hypothetical protein